MELAPATDETLATPIIALLSHLPLHVPAHVPVKALSHWPRQVPSQVLGGRSSQAPSQAPGHLPAVAPAQVASGAASSPLHRFPHSRAVSIDSAHTGGWTRTTIFVAGPSFDRVVWSPSIAA